jgi:hypothetical protein
MRTQQEIEIRLQELLSDERLSYPLATIVENAPLALIQCQLETAPSILQWVNNSTQTTKIDNEKAEKEE